MTTELIDRHMQSGRRPKTPLKPHELDDMALDAEAYGSGHDAVQEWADWSRRHSLGIGYASRCVVGRMMDDRGVLPAGTRVLDRRIPQSDQVAQVEAIMARWYRAWLYVRRGQPVKSVPQIALDRAQYWAAVQARYLSGAIGTDAQAAHARMTRGSYCRRLGLALSAVAGALGLL